MRSWLPTDCPPDGAEPSELYLASNPRGAGRRSPALEQRSFGLAKHRLALVVALAALVACSRGSSGQDPTLSSSPGEIAVAYVNALAAGNYDRAIAFVTPAERNVLEVIAAGNPPTGTANNIAVGSETVTDDSAVVILTGTLCSVAGAKSVGSTGSGGVASSSPSTDAGVQSGGSTHEKNDRCIANQDPSSADPAFRVFLERVPSTGRWFVTFNLDQLPSG